MRENSNHNPPSQSILSTLQGITTHNSLILFTMSIYLTRCSLLHFSNWGRRNSIPLTSNPFFTLAINTISLVFRLHALYSSNHSLRLIALILVHTLHLAFPIAHIYLFYLNHSLALHWRLPSDSPTYNSLLSTNSFLSFITTFLYSYTAMLHLIHKTTNHPSQTPV